MIKKSQKLPKRSQKLQIVANNCKKTSLSEKLKHKSPEEILKPVGKKIL